MFYQNQSNSQTGNTYSSGNLNIVSNNVDCVIPATKKPRKKYSKKNLIPQEGKRIGHWYENQKINYYRFLEKYQKHFLNSQLRRTDKIFKEMANTLQTRGADQCRSHHQKMEKKYGSFKQILKELRVLYGHLLENRISKNDDQIATNMNSPLSKENEMEMNIEKNNFSQEYLEISQQQQQKKECMEQGRSTLFLQNFFTQFMIPKYDEDVDIVDFYLN